MFAGAFHLTGKELADGIPCKMQVIIGDYGNVNDPLEKRVYKARIQLLTVRAEVHWNLADINLNCQQKP